MSTEARPISPTRFREAIQDLPLGNLHAKAAELRNSIDHLKRSNDDLAEFPDDPDCKEAVTENLEVIQRMADRILLLKQEVERRGMRWAEDGDYTEAMLEPGEDVVMNGTATSVNGTANGITTARQAPANAASSTSGRLTDEQLRELLAERMGEPDGDEDGGVHL
jgi:hypothetical protein